MTYRFKEGDVVHREKSSNLTEMIVASCVDVPDGQSIKTTCGHVLHSSILMFNNKNVPRWDWDKFPPFGKGDTVIRVHGYSELQPLVVEIVSVCCFTKETSTWFVCCESGAAYMASEVFLSCKKKSPSPMNMSALSACSEPLPPQPVGTRWVEVHDRKLDDDKCRTVDVLQSRLSNCTDKDGQRIYTLYDFPKGKDGVVLDPVILGGLGYFVNPLMVGGYRAFSVEGASSVNLGHALTPLHGWRLCADHAKATGRA